MKREDIVKTINNLKGEDGHKKVLDVYNAQTPLPQNYKVKMTDAWCATTVSAVFLMNGYSDFSECSCPRMVEKAKKAGLWVEKDSYKPQPGDVVLYDWQDSGKGDDTGVPDHVGIVIEVEGNEFCVREGNKSKTIGNRWMAVDGKFIRGFIVPKFTEGSTAKKESKPSVSSSAKEKPEEKATAKPQGYIIGKTYTVNVKSALNVRKGAGSNYPKVTYSELSNDGRKHATSSGALKPGTRVTCLEIKKVSNEEWMRIPSGWVCAKYLK